MAALRRKLKIRTLFNCLGPLANPARAGYQLLGVGRLELLDLLAGALARLGVRRALLVCGRDGLDEVSLCGPTLVREVRGHHLQAWEWTPDDFGLAPCTLAEIQAAGPAESAALVTFQLFCRNSSTTYSRSNFLFVRFRASPKVCRPGRSVSAFAPKSIFSG